MALLRLTVLSLIAFGATASLRQTPAISDPCKSIECPALKCPATFVAQEVEGHCCGYCVPTDPSMIKDTTDYTTAATEAYATYKTAPYR
jgi:hypothetical protein